MIKPHYLSLLALGGGLALSLGQIQPASAANFLIDDFFTQQTATYSGPPGSGSGNEVDATASAIGGSRDLWVQKTGGANGVTLSATVNPFEENLLRQDFGVASGSTYVTWDGNDNNANPFTGVAYTGLGGIDFSGEATLDINVEFNNLPGPITFTFWDADDPSGSTFATTTFNVPMLGLDSDTTLNQPFAGFTPIGGSLAEILDSVGAIQTQISGEGILAGRDVQLDLVRTTASATTPEPNSALSLVALGVIGGAVSLLKRKKK